jgi:hypothetical protein
VSSRPTPQQRAQRLLTAQSSRTLVSALLILEGKPQRSAEEKLTRSWLCTELESRYPQVAAQLDAWSEAVEGPLSELSYGEVLVAALPPSAVAA